MHADKYRCIAELRKNEKEGRDFRILTSDKNSSAAIIAPHGGKIEPGTSDIACAIARDDLSLSMFEGTKPDSNFDSLHITSTNFDEPECLKLIANCDIVVSVHGLGGRDQRTDVGGRDDALRDAICAQLRLAGFSANSVTTGDHAAISARNICNRGRTGRGVQLEITKGSRESLKGDDLLRYANAVRAAIASCADSEGGN